MTEGKRLYELQRISPPKTDGKELASAPASDDLKTTIDKAHPVSKARAISAVLYYREDERRTLDALKKKCASAGFALAFETPEWDVAIDIAKKRLVDVVIVSDFSTFPLSNAPSPMLDIMMLEEELRDRGASFFVMSDQVGTATSVGRLMFTCLAAMNGYRRTVGQIY